MNQIKHLVMITVSAQEYTHL